MLDTVLIGILFAIGMALLGAGFTVGSTSVATVGFDGARICFFVAFAILIFSLATWLWHTQISVLQRAVSLAAVGAAGLASLFLCINWVDGQEIAILPRLFAGLAKDLPIPQNYPIPPEAVKVFLGTNVAWTTQFPHVIVEIHGEQLLVIDKDRKGIFIKTLRIFDKEGTILARFDDGDYWKSEGIRAKRPDKSTLLIYDRGDREVLRVVYLNPLSIAITGAFLYPSFPVVITDEFMQINRLKWRASAMGGNQVDIKIR